MRLDKFLASSGLGSRSEIKNYIRKGFVTVNSETAKITDLNINPDTDEVCFKSERVDLSGDKYYILNKPAGYVCADTDDDSLTVLSLFPESMRDGLHTVGRLDKDTTGLLLLSTDGKFIHEMISPRKKVEKTYFVVCEKSVTDEDLLKLESGVDIGDDEITKPARTQRGAKDNEIFLTITEGRFHQVKRMLQVTCNKVIFLKRVSFGGVSFDESHLSEGEFRELTESEISILRKG